MKTLRRPHAWFTPALVLLAGFGALLLAQDACTRPESKNLRYYWDRHYWQAAFDGLSAACGVGLLTYDFDRDYTPAGRWSLTAIGLVGAFLYLAAQAQALRRLQLLPLWHRRLGGGDTGETPVPRHQARASSAAPRAILILGAFLGLQVLVILLLWGSDVLRGSAGGLSDACWQGSAGFASLGWVRDAARGADAWPLAATAWIGALGWPLWLFLLPGVRQRLVRARTAIAAAGGYTAFLLAAALLVCAFEIPRGGRRAAIGSGRALSRPSDDLSGQAAPTRFARSLTQVACASGAGIPTETLADRGVSEGTKVTLATVVLLGGLGGSAGGGITWLLFAWAVAGVVAQASRPCPHRRDGGATIAQRLIAAGTACVLSLIALAAVVAIGLLLIETHTASAFQPAPSFADAFVDACSAVGGANLSTGVVDAVTSSNLAAGIRHAHNVYPYGMVWLMLAMLSGRVLPLFVLGRVAERATAD